MGKSIGNVKNFTNKSYFKNFYLKLTQKNRKYLIGYTIAMLVTTILIIIFWPQAPIYGPSAISNGVKTELSKTECVMIENCKANASKPPSDGILKINLPIDNPVAIMGIDKNGEIVKDIKAVNDIFWKVKMSEYPLLLTITQNYNRYQIVIQE